MRPLRVIGLLLLHFPLPAWIVVDITIVWLGIVQGFRWFAPDGFAEHTQAWQAFGVFSFSLVISSLIVGLNEQSTLLSKAHILTRLGLTAALSTVLTYAVIYAALYMEFSRRVAATTVLTYLVTGTSIRMFAYYAIRRIERRLLIVGRRSACESFMSRLKDSFLHTHNVVGFVHNTADEGQAGDGGMTNLGTTEDVVRICREMNIKDIVVCNGSARSPEVMTWMLPCLRMGCRVTNEATFYETSVGQILVDEITSDWFLFTDLKAHCDEYATVKRVFDIVVALAGMLATIPLYPLLALAIKLEDSGPVFYSQDRVGKNGRIFKLYKFRTMKVDAESGATVWAVRNDPRATRVGRLLRRSRLDEIPQFYNILVGDMSVVGPRPERPAIVAELSEQIPYWPERSLVKPGLTGWAQISFHYGNCVEDAKRKLQFDFYYLKHMSLELDFIILLRTIGTFLRGAC